MSPTEHGLSCDSFWLGRQRWRGNVSADPISIGGRVEERKEYGELITKKERRNWPGGKKRNGNRKQRARFNFQRINLGNTYNSGDCEHKDFLLSTKGIN